MKRYFIFGVCFLFMSTVATLLLTWSLWWIFVVPDSVPSRRSFFRELPSVPKLVGEASEFARTTRSVFVFSLAGGWPTKNSAIRITATVFAMLSSLSFAFIATFARERTTRITFAIALLFIFILALIAGVIDSVAMHQVRRECRTRKCSTAIPDDLPNDIKNQKNSLRCECSPDAWFWVTLGMDYILSFTALACLTITVIPWFSKGSDNGSSISRSSSL